MSKQHCSVLGSSSTGREADSLGVLEVCLHRSDDDARLNGEELDPYEGDTSPGINDDTLIEDAVDDLYQT